MNYKSENDKVIISNEIKSKLEYPSNLNWDMVDDGFYSEDILKSIDISEYHFNNKVNFNSPKDIEILNKVFKRDCNLVSGFPLQKADTDKKIDICNKILKSMFSNSSSTLSCLLISDDRDYSLLKYRVGKSGKARIVFYREHDQENGKTLLLFIDPHHLFYPSTNRRRHNQSVTKDYKDDYEKLINKNKSTGCIYEYFKTMNL